MELWSLKKYVRLVLYWALEKRKKGTQLSRNGDSESVKIKLVDTVTLFTAKSSERSNKPCSVRLIIALVYNL